MQYRLVVCVVAAVVLFSGCEKEPLVSPPVESNINDRVALEAAAAEAVAMVAMKQSAGEPLDFDEELLALSEQLPGFAGLFVNGQGEVVVRMKGHKRFAADQVRNMLKVRMKDAPGLSQALDNATHLLGARYTFPELYSWKVKARKLFDVPGVMTIDADEFDNVIRVGVRDVATSMRVRSELIGLGLPTDAFAIELTGGIKPAYKLTEHFRPLEGGFQIYYNVGSNVNLCTLGFTVYRNGQLGFIINSHCTAIRGSVDGTTIYQGSSSIGYETVDPAFQPYGSGTAKTFAPPADGRLHRRSDAAFIRATTTDVNGGRIARTQSRGTTSGSITRSGNFVITAEATTQHVLGTQLNKVGRTTGWTYGNITNTCFESVLRVPPGAPPLVLDCQYYVGSGVGAGDSGSPVFSWNGIDNNVMLFGILWGCATDVNTDECLTVNPKFVYSPISGIELDLGALTTF